MTAYLNAALDERDQHILHDRQAALDAHSGPRVGDWVEFADGVLRRISHIWPESVQTSDGGSYYLGDGFVSMSGALYTAVPASSLKRTERSTPGRVWFFHHEPLTQLRQVAATGSETEPSIRLTPAGRGSVRVSRGLPQQAAV